MKATIKKLAKELKISPAAVSMALNDREGISESLRLKVKKMAKQLGYLPYLNARYDGMYKQTSKLIAIVYIRGGGHLIEEIQCGFDKIRKYGYYELRYTIDINKDLTNDEKKQAFFMDLVEKGNIAGILAVSINISDNLIAKLNRQKIPVVLLDSYTDYGKCIIIDNQQAAYESTKKFIKLGYKNIGLMIAHDDSEKGVFKERFEGYRKALIESNLKYDPNLVVYENTFLFKEAGYATKYLIEENPSINAILYGSDIQAQGGMKVIQDMGKVIPDDIAIIGFDDMPVNEVLKPSLSSVKQPLKEMGDLGAEMLLTAIKEKNFSYEIIKLESELILRGSCIKDYKNAKWV